MDQYKQETIEDAIDRLQAIRRRFDILEDELAGPLLEASEMIDATVTILENLVGR